MRRFLIAIALTCALSGFAVAGEMPTCGVPSSGSPTPISSAPGDIPSVNSTAPADIPTCGLSLIVTLIDLAF